MKKYAPRELFATFRNGRKIKYTYEILRLLSTDPDVIEISDAITDKVIFTRRPAPEAVADPAPEAVAPVAADPAPVAAPAPEAVADPAPEALAADPARRVVKIGPVELSEAEAEQLYAAGKYIVTYGAIYELQRGGRGYPHVYGRIIYRAKGMTRRGRFHAMTASAVNALAGCQLVNHTPEAVADPTPEAPAPVAADPAPASAPAPVAADPEAPAPVAADPEAPAASAPEAAADPAPVAAGPVVAPAPEALAADPAPVAADPEAPALHRPDLMYCNIGPGTRVYDRSRREYGDYKRVAFIDEFAEVSVYVNDLPRDVLAEIYTRGAAHAAEGAEKYLQYAKTGAANAASYPSAAARLESNTARFGADMAARYAENAETVRAAAGTEAARDAARRATVAAIRAAEYAAEAAEAAGVAR